MKPILSLLVATDFSDDAARAIQRGARLANKLTARLQLLHVMSGPSLQALRELFPNPAEAEAKIFADAQRMLDEQADALEQNATTTVKVGKVLEEILAACDNTDLLVLGARGLNPLRDLLLGTTAERLLRKCMRPVLVVKQETKAPYRQVIVPVDFSPHSVQAFMTALSVAPDAQITLLHAFDVPFEGKLWVAGVAEDEINRYRIHARQEAQAKCKELIQQNGADIGRVSCVVVRGDAPRVILEHEKKLAADLIVIGKHGQSRVEELFLGSVTRHVLSDAECDVLVVHEQP